MRRRSVVAVPPAPEPEQPRPVVAACQLCGGAIRDGDPTSSVTPAGPTCTRSTTTPNSTGTTPSTLPPDGSPQGRLLRWVASVYRLAGGTAALQATHRAGGGVALPLGAAPRGAATGNSDEAPVRHLVPRDVVDDSTAADPQPVPGEREALGGTEARCRGEPARRPCWCMCNRTRSEGLPQFRHVSDSPPASDAVCSGEPWVSTITTHI